MLTETNAMRLPSVLGLFAAALICSVAGTFFVLPLGLVASEYVIFPLALFVAGIFAALGASWAGNFLAGDGSCTRLLHVVGITEAGAALLALLFLAVADVREALLGPVFYPGLFCALALAVVAAIATVRFRRRKRNKDRLITVMLVVLAVVSVPVAIFLAWLAGLAGA
jgi:hypothetical protein